MQAVKSSKLEFEQCLTNVQLTLDDLGTEYLGIQTNSDNLILEWIGNSKEDFSTAIVNVKARFLNCSEELLNLKDHINSTLKITAENDTTISSKFE